MGYKFTDNTDKFVDRHRQEADLLMAALAAEVLTLSWLRVPYAEGWLHGSASYNKLADMQYVVGYGRLHKVPYARRWEFARENEPNVHFQRGRRSAYLRSSVEDVAPKYDKQIKNIVARIKL